MKAKIYNYSQLKQVQQDATQAASKVVTKHLINIVLNILKLDYSWSEKELEAFYNKFVQVTLELSEPQDESIQEEGDVKDV